MYINKAALEVKLCNKKMKYLNSLPNKQCFLPVCRTSLLKILWEKEKLLEKFPTEFSACLDSGELSAIFVKFDIVVSFCESKIRRLGKGSTFFFKFF